MAWAALGWRRPTWTRELLCLQMAREGRPRVSVCTMGRVLARIGARLGCPKPIVLCPRRRDARERRLAEIQALEARASAQEPVFYSDEVDIHLNPKIGRDWMLRGHQRRVVPPGKNEKFYLAGALEVRSGRLVTTGAARKNAALFCELLRLLASRYRRARRIHLVVDNYGIHKAQLTERTLLQLVLRGFRLHPGSQDRLRRGRNATYAQRRDRDRARGAGFDEHFVKPIDLEILGRVLTME